MRIHLVIPASASLLRSPAYAALQPGMLPLSLAYLGAALRRAGHTVTLRDQTADLRSNRRVLEEVRRAEPDLLGLSVLTEGWGNTLELAAGARRLLPGLRLVMGNIHASVFAGQILREGQADFVVRGEGEQTLVRLAEVLDAGAEPGQVRGLSWRCGEEILHNPDRPPLEDLDALPYPAWDLLDRDAWRYQRLPLMNLDSPGVPLMASRGCPHGCTFCAQDPAARRFRRRGVAAIVAEVDLVVRRLGYRTFGFNDSYFPWSQPAGLEFCQRLDALPWRRHTPVRWVTQVRADESMLDDGLMAAMRRSGLHALACGFESGDDRVLQAMGKGTTVAQGRELVRLAHRHGVRVVGFFIIGLPGETPETIRATVRFALESGVDMAKFAVAVPYPGSPLFPLLGKETLTVEECEGLSSWSGWSGGGRLPLYAPAGITPARLLGMQRGAMARFYGRPAYLWRALREGILSPEDLARGARVLLGLK